MKEKRLKIAFVVVQFPCISETFILNQISGLIDLGHEVDIFAFEKPNPQHKLHEEVGTYGMLDRTTYLKPIPKNDKKRILGAFGLVLKYIFLRPQWILRCLNFKKFKKYEMINNLFRAEPFLKRNYDVVHCHFGPNGIHMLGLKKLCGSKVRFLTTFYGFDLSRFILDEGNEVYNDLFQNGDLFLPICRYFKDILVKLGCEDKKAEILHIGIDFDKFKQVTFNKLDKNGTRKILTIGRLVEKKGHEYALKAVADIVKKGYKIHFIIAGDGPLKEHLLSLVKELKIESCVEFLGPVVGSDIRKLYLQSEIFLLPSVTAKDGDQEGTPVVLMEAMASGLPVISTRHSGIPEMIADKKCGFLVPERDVKTLSEKIEYLINNPNMYAQMGQMGRRIIKEEFNTRNLNNRLEEYYYESLGNGH